MKLTIVNIFTYVVIYFVTSVTDTFVRTIRILTSRKKEALISGRIFCVNGTSIDVIVISAIFCGFVTQTHRRNYLGRLHTVDLLH